MDFTKWIILNGFLEQGDRIGARSAHFARGSGIAALPEECTPSRKSNRC